MHPKEGKPRKPSNPIVGEDRGREGGGGGMEAQRNRGQKGRWKGKEQEMKVLKGKKVGELGEIMR